jgi:hypothetical protein
MRAIILAAAVVVGLVGLTKAFPEGGSAPFVPTAGGSPSAVTSPTPSPTVSPTPTATPRVEGVVVQVLNGSGVDFLAAKYTNRIKRLGYSVNDPGNANRTPTTIVYYQAGFQPEAEFLKTRCFGTKASVRRATQAAASDADLTVILGENAPTKPCA